MTRQDLGLEQCDLREELLDNAIELSLDLIDDYNNCINDREPLHPAEILAAIEHILLSAPG